MEFCAGCTREPHGRAEAQARGRRQNGDPATFHRSCLRPSDIHEARGSERPSAISCISLAQAASEKSKTRSNRELVAEKAR